MGSPCSRSPSADADEERDERAAHGHAPAPERCASGGRRTCAGIRTSGPGRSARPAPGPPPGTSAENMVAYQPGKAAKSAAPATISHTSLPSQTGPMVLTALAAPCRCDARKECSMPTPKSNPFEDEEADPQDGDDDEPEVSERHRGPPSRRAPARRRRPSSVPADGACSVDELGHGVVPERLRP